MEPTELKEIIAGDEKKTENNDSLPNLVMEENAENANNSNNPLPTFEFPLSQSSNPDINELLNTEPLDSSDVDPKSWDTLYSSVTSMSPVMYKNNFLSTVGQTSKDKGLEEGASTSHSDLCLSNTSTRTVNLIPSQNDSGLGDNSVISGLDVDVSAATNNNDNNQTPNNENEESEETGPRYPKRSIERLNYKDLEVPEDDEFIWCEDCQTEYKGDCPFCGPLVIVKDTPALEGDPHYASKTLPDILLIDESTIPGAGSGVFARNVIQKGVRFGPYQGKCVLNEEEAHDSGYSWEIQRSGKTSYYVDARAVSASNWMRYVNCARNSVEQNLLAFQYCGHIYYRTLRVVRPREELLVWYGDAYGEELGLTTITEDLARYWDQEFQGFHCPQNGCSALYSTHDMLIVHLLLRHKIIVSQVRYHCPYCRQSCATETQLRIHRQTCLRRENPIEMNTEMYQHQCDVCGKPFKNKHDVQTHMRVHTGERPHVCNMCGKGFTQLAPLTRHVRIHTGEKPFKCTHCGKAFSDKRNLQSHVRIHTGEKPFKCDVCAAAFNKKSNLTRHMRTHTGDKPYKCDVCGLAFTYSHALNSHKWTHTDKRPQQCDICGQGFMHPNQVRKHIAKCHS